MRIPDTMLLVANPTSGGGRAGQWCERVAKVFRDAGIQVRTLLTRRAGDARKAAEHCGDCRLLVVFGGDGTINEVLNGADLERCVLGVVPAGTGNVLAKELGMARNPVEAARQLIGGRVVRFDMGVANGRRFACVFGAGVDGAVVKAVHEGRGAGLTQWHYVPHVAAQVLGVPPWRIGVTLDGKPFATGVHQVCVGNTRSYGGPIAMTPAAGPGDGRLDVMCMKLGAPIDTMGKVACLFLRRVDLHPGVRYGRGCRIECRSEGPAVPYEVDGEPGGWLPATVEVREGALRLLAPAGFRAVRAARETPHPGGDGRSWE